MIIATTLRLDIYRGARFAEVLRLTQGKTTQPVDLTGRGPFLCQVRDEIGGELLLAITVEETDLADGRITIIAEMAATSALPADFQRGVVDVIDAFGLPWVAGVAYLKSTVSQSS